MTTQENPRPIDISSPNRKKDIARFAIEGLLLTGEREEFSPFGLVEFIDGEVWPVQEFNPRDPFGHLGKAKAETMAFILYEALAGTDDSVLMQEVESQIGNIYPASILEAYLLATILRKAHPEVEGSTEARARKFGGIASRSYGGLIDKLAYSDVDNATVAMWASTWNRDAFACFSRGLFPEVFPLGSNPFMDRAFNLETTGADKMKVTNDAFSAVSSRGKEKPSERKCGEVEARLDDGSLALKASWSYITDMAVANHFRDENAIEWALSNEAPDLYIAPERIAHLAAQHIRTPEI